MHLAPDHQQRLLDLARESIRCAIMRQRIPPLPAIEELLQPAGCFVSLHETRAHRLRGCVGRLDAKAGVAETVCAMAQAVLEDPRFVTDPVTPDELPDLDIELSILSPLRPATDPLEFDLLHDGIYLTHGPASGCFLPQVARETGWGKETLLDRLCTEKLRLPSSAWRDERARLYRFSTLLIGPAPLVNGRALER
jgi:AmmeMemoRadiSam system protein A